MVAKAEPQTLCVILALDASLKTVQLQVGEEDAFHIDRLDLLNDYQVHVVIPEKIHRVDTYPSPTRSYDAQCNIWKGLIQASMVDYFNKSSEDHVDIHQSPKVKVIATKGFNEGCLKLVGLTNHISITSIIPTPSDKTIILGKCFETNGKSKEKTNT